MPTPQNEVVTHNDVALHEKGYIAIRVVGKQSRESVKAMADQVRPIAAQLRAQAKPVLILDDLTTMDILQPASVGRTVGEEAKSLDFDKVAMLGSSNILFRYGSNLIIKGVGMTEKMRYFSDRAEAEAWLFE